MLRLGVMFTLLNLIWIPPTLCACGHSGLLTSVTVIPTFGVLLYYQLRARHSPLPERLIGWFFLIVHWQFLLMNMRDVLWMGHDAWLI